MATVVKPRDSHELLEAGIAHHRAGNLAKAESAYKKALARNPRDPHALHLAGLLALDRGRAERALQLIDKALVIAPKSPDFLHSAGAALAALGRFEGARERYEAALAVDPRRPMTLNNLGNVLKKMDQLDAARARIENAVALDPGFAEGWSNLGLVHKARGDCEAAAIAFAHAIVIRPEQAEFHYNLGNARLDGGEPEAAVAAYHDALSRNPAHGQARVNLATALKRLARLDEALGELETLVQLVPDYADAHWNLALTLLMKGSWARGWKEFEWRRRVAEYALVEPTARQWDGGSLGGGRLLVLHEQGFGDALQFMRFARDAAERGVEVIYRGPKAMLPIVGRIDGVSRTESLDAPLPEFEAWAPMMSLPHILHAGDALDHGAYLTHDASRLPPFRRHLDQTADSLRIGIAWQGNAAYALDAERSIALSHFECLARVPGVALFALQKGEGAEQVRRWPRELPLIDLGPEIDCLGGAFMDTAAVLSELDAVVTSDTALAHLAGAMGCPVHLALAYVPDWRWGLNGTRTPWYPSMMLHRQDDRGDWAGVFQGLAEYFAEQA